MAERQPPGLGRALPLLEAGLELLLADEGDRAGPRRRGRPATGADPAGGAGENRHGLGAAVAGRARLQRDAPVKHLDGRPAGADVDAELGPVIQHARRRRVDGERPRRLGHAGRQPAALEDDAVFGLRGELGRALDHEDGAALEQDLGQAAHEVQRRGRQLAGMAKIMAGRANGPSNSGARRSRRGLGIVGRLLRRELPRPARLGRTRAAPVGRDQQGRRRRAKHEDRRRTQGDPSPPPAPHGARHRQRRRRRGGGCVSVVGPVDRVAVAVGVGRPPPPRTDAGHPSARPQIQPAVREERSTRPASGGSVPGMRCDRRRHQRHDRGHAPAEFFLQQDPQLREVNVQLYGLRVLAQELGQSNALRRVERLLLERRHQAGQFCGEFAKVIHGASPWRHS